MVVVRVRGRKNGVAVAVWLFGYSAQISLRIYMSYTLNKCINPDHIIQDARMAIAPCHLWYAEEHSD